MATAHLAASSRGPSIGTPVIFYSVPTRIGHAVLSCKPKLQRATPRIAGDPLRLRNLDDWAWPADRRPERFLCFHNVGEADAIVLGPDCF